MTRLTIQMMIVLFMLPVASAVLGQAESWPRTVGLDRGTVTIYAPQVEAFDGTTIRYRAALAYREKPGADPVFGAGWFESAVTADRGGERLRPADPEVSELRFPPGTGDISKSLVKAMERESKAGNLDFSLAEIQGSLDRAAAESRALEQLNTDPPRIIYRDHPALLVSLDGEPVIRGIENSPYRAVINTPYPLITDGTYYYLNVAKNVWYRAGEATGPYRFEPRPPAGIAALVDDQDSGAGQAETDITAANAPEIVVSTEPAELVVTEGPAAFVPLVDDLLVLQNSDDDVFMHVGEQKFYIVLAGRWYESASLNGPWAYRPSDQLPAAFADIPEHSSQADSRVYVAGTEESRQAVLDAQVPQAVAVKRGEADIDVQYDGEPLFEDVDGADLEYASNTGSSVILANGRYYLVEDGVWYLSSSPNGPWRVSDHRPDQVVSILPTSPVYNVRYVYVYDSTPDVVYVGYTPGYLGSYVYHNTIFYGSGWYYAPWVSPYYYYPRHATWGLNVSYNSWSGWNFGLSWGWGPFSVSYYSGGYWHRSHYWHHRHYGRWGPGRYRPRPYHREPYRHHRPRARVAGTHDVTPRRTDQKGRSYDKQSYRNGRYAETGTVKKRAIKSKANARDANARASRKQLWADNNDRAQRSPGKTALKQGATGRRTPSGKDWSRPVSYSKPVQQRSEKLASLPVRKQSRQKPGQLASRARPSQKQGKSTTVRNQVKPQVFEQQGKPRVVQGQGNPRVVQRQGKSQVVQRQSRPQVVQQQRSSAPAKQERQKVSDRSFASRQGSKAGADRIGKSSARQRGRRQ